MKTHHVSGTLGVLTTCSVIALFAALGNAQTPTPGQVTMQDPNKILERRARSLDVNNEAQVRALVDDVFSFPRSYPRLVPALEALVKDRLVRSETAYLQGARPGVSEADVVRLFNLVATRFNAPNYAKTSRRQVRVLRMALAVSLPAFMGRGMVRETMEPGQSVSEIMSPVQATHLIATLIEQKLRNPDYQLSPKEWDRDQYEKSLRTWQSIQELKRTGRLEQLPQKAHAELRDENPKKRELHEVMKRGISSLSLSDAWDLMDQLLSILDVR